MEEVGGFSGNLSEDLVHLAVLRDRTWGCLLRAKHHSNPLFPCLLLSQAAVHPT